MGGVAAAALAPRLCQGENERKPLKMAISADTLIGANIDDARAAYRIWIQEAFPRSLQVEIDIVPEIFLSSEEIVSDIRKGTVDCFGVNALELEKVGDLTDPNRLLLLNYLADGIDYVLLVHNSSPFRKIDDLRGKQILSHLNHDMVLAPVWLSTMFAASNLPQPERFFASQTLCEKLNQVVLPVFFRRADAACLTRRNWETAVELNPQLGRDLRPLAVSPKVIPCAIGMRRSCNAQSRDSFIESLIKMVNNPMGKQLLALYQATGFVVRPISAMKSTLDMVREFERLSTPQTGSRKGKV
jgi:ABC-type phosphate/phosphonate transport system substrate-binding protein